MTIDLTNNLLLTTTYVPTMANIFGVKDLSYQEVSAIIGILAVVGGVVIKIFYKPDERLKERLELLEVRFDKFENDEREKIREIKDTIERVEDKISEDRERDNDNRDRAIEKIENRIEKLSDYIMKLIEKL